MCSSYCGDNDPIVSEGEKLVAVGLSTDTAVALLLC